LEKPLTGTKGANEISSSQKDFAAEARAALSSKADSVKAQLNRLNLKSEKLDKEKLTKLFYDIFNDNRIDHQETQHLIRPMTLGKESVNAGH
jgi:hypothetical protein